jgi:hypothetical protein
MKYTSVNIDQNKKTQKRNSGNNVFREFISGDFLLQRKTLQLLPFIILFFGLALTAILNEKNIKNKSKKIDKKEIEYKLILDELRRNNQFIPYDQLNIIQEQAKAMGYVKNNPNTFKITITSTPNN